MKIKVLQFSFLIALLSCHALSSQIDPLVARDSLAQQQWVDSTYNAMSTEERIGQLFMVMVSTSQGEKERARIDKWIQEYHLGGLIFSRGGPLRQAAWTNHFQEHSKTPLLIGMDAEWGLAMRLDSTFAFPWNGTLGAITDTTVVEAVGYRIGKHVSRLGVHINFAPVADVNIDPRNPIIGNRSFGEDPDRVAQGAAALMRGMHRAGVLSSAKHFPGHGDTAADSHSTLPLISYDRQRLDTVELHPYPELIRQGLHSVMVAHLNVPVLTGSTDRPTSLSGAVIQRLLRREMDFKGLVFTDALNMKGVTSYDEGTNTSLQAFMAGNDMLLMPKNLEADRVSMLEAYNSGIISEARLSNSVRKILKAKYLAGLHTPGRVDAEGLYSDLNHPSDSVAYEQAMEEAITVLKNPVGVLPVRKLENKRIAYVPLGPSDHDAFVERLQMYAKIDVVSPKTVAGVTDALKGYNLIIAGWHGSNASPWAKDRIKPETIRILEAAAGLRSSNFILTVFGRPYVLGDIPSFDDMDGLVMGYQNSRIAQETAAELLFGVFPAKGRLPVSAHPEFPEGSGLDIASLQRLGYSWPGRVGLDRQGLARVDTLVQHGLDSLMFPGAQLLIARHGQVIYHKAFGYHTDRREQAVSLNDLYDLASLTKILSTLPIIMKMEEEGSIRLNDTFSQLLPEYEETALRDVTVLKALSHYGRLPSWIAFYLATLDKDRKPSAEFYRNGPREGYSTQVADHLYLTDAYQDSIYNRIGRQRLKSNRYRYSDVAYYVFKKYIESYQKQGLDQIAERFLFRPLGTTRTTFLPLERFPKSSIIPSEVDDYYRYQIVHGHVHDMGAAMQGGVGGHAGLFSNANGVAKIMQMYLQGGTYGGDRFVESRTVEKFNRCYFCNRDVRRGVGFDKPQLGDTGPTCGCVSPRSFGHSGFTGTYTWADPDSGILYVFLSNRTYPKASNTLLVRSALRTRIQQAIYDSIINQAQN